MNNTTNLILINVAKSLLYWAFFILYCVIRKKEMPDLNALLFFLPYYLLWLFLMVTCIIRTGRTMKILWMGTLRDPEVFSGSNTPYAFAFIIGCVLLIGVQSWYAW